MLSFITRGTPFQCGQQQGRAAAALARRWIRRTLEDLRRRRGSPSVAAVVAGAAADVERWQRQWEEADRYGLLEECRGLACGLEMAEAEYFTLACYHRLAGALPQCTLVGRTDGADPAFAKTDDIGRADLGMNTLEVTHPASGYRHLHFHFAGTPWTVAGMNERGLAMGMTGIPGPLLEQAGLFSLLALHTVLPRCADVGQAVDHLRQVPVNAYGFGLLLADPQGRLVLVEKTGAGMTAHEAAPGEALAHTNHILDPAFAERNPRQMAPIDANGRRRLDQARALADAGCPLEQTLADRSPAGAICQRGEDGLYTDFAAVFEPSRRQIRLWSGPPCSAAPAVLDVERLLA